MPVCLNNPGVLKNIICMRRLWLCHNDWDGWEARRGCWAEPWGLDVGSSLNSFCKEVWGEERAMEKWLIMICVWDGQRLEDLFTDGLKEGLSAPILFLYLFLHLKGKPGLQIQMAMPQCRGKSARGTGSCSLANVSGFVQQRKGCWCFGEEILFYFLTDYSSMWKRSQIVF